jgi:hypothetical protein
MNPSAPAVDARTATSIRDEVLGKLRDNLPEWSDQSIRSDEATVMLAGVFARLCELVIQRLNQAPDKNLLAYLDLLGASFLPPQPARAPLTFTVAPGTLVDARVPAGTQAAAPPPEGRKDPVVYETERELTATAASLTALIAIDPQRDTHGDYADLLARMPGAGVPVFAGKRPNERILYIAHAGYLGYARIERLEIGFELLNLGVEELDERELAWEVWDGSAWTAIEPVSDGTQALRASGAVVFPALAAVPERVLERLSGRWLRCRLLTPVWPGEAAADGMMRAAHLPVVSALQLRVQVDRNALGLDAAISNAQPVDFTQAFYPFGEQPKFGDGVYLAQGEALSQPGGVVSIDLTLVNPLDGTGPTSPIPVKPSSDLQLRWEVSGAGGWLPVGDAKPGSTRDSDSEFGFEDGTEAFTRSGRIKFTLPENLGGTAVNGLAGRWLRVRIVAGNYGAGARYVLKTAGKPEDGYVLYPETFAPPVIATVAVSYSLTTAPVPPDQLLAYNNLEHESLGPTLAAGQAVVPFRPCPVQLPTLYLGFSIPDALRGFGNRTLSLYHAVTYPRYAERAVPLDPDASVLTALAGQQVEHRFRLTNSSVEPWEVELSVFGYRWFAELSQAPVLIPAGEWRDVVVKVAVPEPAALAPGETADGGFLRLFLASDPETLYSARFLTRLGESPPPRRTVRWQYWNGSDWTTIPVQDDTERFGRAGIVQVLPPADCTKRSQFGGSRYWLRAQLEAGDDAMSPRIRAILPNTTMAVQATTIRNEILGSSDASAEQRLRTAHSPVLAGQELEVREPERPSAADEVALREAHGADAVTEVRSAAGRVSGYWVRWVEVPDFYGSGPRDRHYVLDHLTGYVLFGDNLHGRIPPRGTGNLRMAQYRIGGGPAGNCPARTIIQLKTTIPYIDGVYNPEPAAGGADAETLPELLERAPRMVRHGSRSVTREDYEDLARLATPEVARARCVPLRRLQGDPLGLKVVRGAVSVIVVPDSREPKPLPSVELLTRVRDRLREHGAPLADISVVGPLYLRVDVSVDLVLSSLEGASLIEDEVYARLAAYLHPLTGGLDGAGWDFGREPYRSDLYALLGAVAGVDHIRRLTIDDSHQEPPGAKDTGRFLVYSGRHQVNLMFMQTA